MARSQDFDPYEEAEFTYDPRMLNDEIVGTMMQVRLKIGDTGPDFILSDEEVKFFLIQYKDEVPRASLEAVISIIAKLNQEGPDFKLGPYSENNSSRINFYMRLRKQLEGQLSSINAPLMFQPTTAPIFGFDIMSSNGIKYGEGGSFVEGAD